MRVHVQRCAKRRCSSLNKQPRISFATLANETGVMDETHEDVVVLLDAPSDFPMQPGSKSRR
jgi:hypothetical protein